MDGIKKKMDPGDEVRDDIFKMTKSDRTKRGIGVLPKSLGEALDELESDRKFLNPIYTNDVIDKIIELERRDQREISIRPHPHEFYLYFDVQTRPLSWKIQYNEIAISANPPPRNIPLLFSEVAALYNNTPPARPTNNTKTPTTTLSKLVLVISGWKNPANNAKNATK